MKTTKKPSKSKPTATKPTGNNNSHKKASKTALARVNSQENASESIRKATLDAQNAIEAALRQEFPPDVLVAKIRELMECEIPQVRAKMVELVLHYTEGKPIARKVVEHRRTLTIDGISAAVEKSPAVRRGLERMLSRGKIIDVSTSDA